ncbi:antitoxin MazE family protein [Xylella fastidiosa]|uniref:antitoxin MazE family protein n=1 Tax=Xylella fastidiosa TaxID=2371 RepID=UPI0007333CFD|nr:antitoxin MazE family protein [Xylella fastidiosa]
MTSIHRPDSKVVRHREQMRSAGLRPVQFWVPDTRTPEFAAEIRSQCRALKGDQAEADALRFTEKAITHIEGWK